MDTIPEVLSQKDALSGQILKELNDTLEKMVDSYVDANMAMDIPVLLYRPGQKTIIEKQNYVSGGKTLTRSVSRSFAFTYDNYFYGKKATEITDASECSLIAGSTF